MSDIETEEPEDGVFTLLIEEPNPTAKEHPNEVVEISPLNTESPEILRLYIDCFEEIFEWLSMTDLRRLRKTCKRLKQEVDFNIHKRILPSGSGLITEEAD